ncbi:MAG: thiol:disulfide interchange protein DsbA/DsbL [Aquincola sp.]|nr:thiol:disulfide interchange protein DsbA/DsbL [Aquincola sp.]MDH4287515.1 thiol:disulfide interchange protein DsbA/DsbL [Aquincola sp.]
MNRRDWTRATAAMTLMAAGIARAQANAPVEGRDYVRLNPPVAVPAGGKIDVIEFFSYGCPHCYAFEPILEAWIKKLPPDVAFRRVPAAFNAPFEGYAKLFYALEAIGMSDALHRRVFAAIHVQRQRLDKEADIAAFVQSAGGDGAKFVDAYKSFGVATKVRQGKQLSEAYKIDGVPTLGIHGRFFTSGSLAGSHERSLVVADQLIARARKPS